MQTGRSAGLALRVKPHTCAPGIPLYFGMPLLNVVLTLIVVGVILWLINTYIPMQGTIKKILNFVVVVVVILWLLYGFGIINGSGDVHMPVVK
jgi:ABC-type long-subunit fatty acid transport system fused permease/ATPase subunit